MATVKAEGAPKEPRLDAMGGNPLGSPASLDLPRPAAVVDEVVHVIVAHLKVILLGWSHHLIPFVIRNTTYTHSMNEFCSCSCKLQ